VPLFLAAALAGCGVIGTARQLTAAQEAIADMKIDPSDLTITGWVDRDDRTYRTGQRIKFSVWVNRDAYVAVLRVLRNGKTTLLFPNKLQPKAMVPASMTVNIPGAGDRFEIVAGKQTPELIEFVASTKGDSWLFTRKPEGSATFVELGTTTKELAKDIAAALEGKGDGEGKDKDKDKGKGGKAMGAAQSIILAIE